LPFGQAFCHRDYDGKSYAVRREWSIVIAMITFLVRVELQGVQDYLPLHAAMSKRKFKRVITRADGKTFALPTGQYRYKGDDSIDIVVKRARKAVHSVNYDDASIFVSEISGASRFSKLREHHAAG
jgi:hypothetical protein